MNAKLLFLATLLVASGFFIYSSITTAIETVDFESVLVQLDTSAVAHIEIQHVDKKQDYNLTRQNLQWIVSNQLVSVPALTTPIDHILASFIHVPTDKIMTNNEEEWKIYNVGHEQGYTLHITTDDNQEHIFVIGYLANDDYAFMRLEGDKSVYRIPPEIAIACSKKMSDYRPQQLLQLPEQVLSIAYHRPDTTYTITPTNKGWVNNISKKVIDSIAIQKYLASISPLHSQQFVDNFDETSPHLFTHKSIQFKGEQDSITIYCYRDTTREQPFIFHSGINERSWFISDSSGLYKTVIWPLDTLLKVRPI